MNPIILYDNGLLNYNTISVSSTASGYNKFNTLDARLFTGWKPNSAGSNYIQYEFTAENTFDTLGIAGHNLNTCNATIKLEAYNLEILTWTTLINNFTVSNDYDFLKTFENEDTGNNYYKLSITTSSVAPELAVVFIGNRLTMEYPPDAPFIPITETMTSETQVNERGYMLGIVQSMTTVKCNHSFSYLTQSFIDNYYMPFWNNHAKLRKDLFYSWDNQNFPENCIYGRFSSDYVLEMNKSILNYVDSLMVVVEGVRNA